MVKLSMVTAADAEQFFDWMAMAREAWRRDWKGIWESASVDNNHNYQSDRSTVKRSGSTLPVWWLKII